MTGVVITAQDISWNGSLVSLWTGIRASADRRNGNRFGERHDDSVVAVKGGGRVDYTHYMISGSRVLLSALLRLVVRGKELKVTGYQVGNQFSFAQWESI